MGDAPNGGDRATSEKCKMKNAKSKLECDSRADPRLDPGCIAIDESQDMESTAFATEAGL